MGTTRLAHVRYVLRSENIKRSRGKTKPTSGPLDRALAMSKSSDFPTFNPFRFTTSAVDAQEDPDLIAGHVGGHSLR